LFHKKHVDDWQKSLNPIQKLVNAVLGDNATKLGVPAKPEHPDVIAKRKAAEKREFFSGDQGFAQRDV
jgi:hypothetical protein